MNLAAQAFILATVHRAENTDRPNILRSILKGLAQVSEDLPVVLPLHPRTRAAMAGLRSRLRRG
ncbi:MAG: UDP-N-acetylglucosamine 2-epimerase [Gemmatimonadales bacterium]